MWFDFVFPGPCRLNEMAVIIKFGRRCREIGKAMARSPQGQRVYRLTAKRYAYDAERVVQESSCRVYRAYCSVPVWCCQAYQSLQSYLHTQCLSASVTSSDDLGTTCTLAYSDIRAIPYLFTSFFVSSKATAGPDSCKALQSFCLIADHGGGLAGFNTILPRSPGRDDHNFLS